MPVSIGTTTVTALYLGTTSITSAYLGATQVFGGASAFTPLDLFSGGAQGIWLDPSDLTTMFSDRAGTIQVTTPGTVVGKRLDKSGRGNHATAPTDAARPIYGVEPKGGRRNLLLATDTLATQSLTVTAVAHTLAFTGTGTVTLSGASTAGPLVGTGAGNRVSLTFTPTAASLTLTVSGSVTLGQLELGSSATAYQKVVTAYNVTESGVDTCHYVQYDGSDDGVSTAPIDFTGTDKVSIFVGIRKSSGAQNSVLEFGQPTALGFFALWTGRPSTDGPTYHFNSGGNIFVTAEAPLNFPSPINNLLTCLGDISGDRATLRINGTQEAQQTANQGTGNYRTYPLYIGRFQGTFGALNGRDYGIVIVGKAASAGEITDTETWLAARTSGVTI